MSRRPSAVQQRWAALSASPAPATDPPDGVTGAWVPEQPDLRADPGRRGVLVLGGLALAACAVAAGIFWQGRPRAVAAGVPHVSAPSVATDAGPVVVDVAGRVRRPGLVRLPVGARVDDAVRAAGGLLPGVSTVGLNLARKVVDGEQVVVGASVAAAVGDARLDLNTADVAAFEDLPGIGPVLAERIVDWRTEHGRFAAVDQLREVSGIGEAKFAAIKVKVRV
jgi:competence protein ComEA